MTFILRQVTKRAAGGEIVRQRDVGDGPLRIGRGADCEIRVPDLAVSLHHATLSLEAPGQVRIEAAGDQPFGVDGRFTRSAVVTAARGATLSFGDYHLEISAGEDGSVLLSLAQAATTSAQSGASTSARLIPPPRLLGKRRLAWAGVTLIGLICLVLPVLALNGVLGGWIHPRIDVDAQWSSGPLSKSHAFLENDCQACHQKAFVAIRDDSCKACHSAGQSPDALKRTVARITAAGSPDAPALIADHAGQRRMLWGMPVRDDWAGRVVGYARKLFNKPEQRCVSCHTEHVGDPLTDPARTKPTLLTAHSCTQCHADLGSRLKDTALLDTPDWRRHPELRPRVTLSPGPLKIQRISMALHPKENPGLVFPHDLHMKSTGGPARMAITLGAGRGYGAPLGCASCHTPQANGDNYQPINMEKACSACHSLNVATGAGVRPLPHGDPRKLAAFFQGSGGPVSVSGPGAGRRRRPGDPEVYSGVSASAAQRLRGVFAPGGACSGCHAVTPPTDGGAIYRVAPVYLANSFLTTGSFNHRIKAHRQHTDGKDSCLDCHKADTSGSAKDLMEPDLAVCAGCHGKEKAKAPQAAGADCADCHSYHAPRHPARKPDDKTHHPELKAQAARVRPVTWGAGR